MHGTLSRLNAWTPKALCRSWTSPMLVFRSNVVRYWSLALDFDALVPRWSCGGLSEALDLKRIKQVRWSNGTLRDLRYIGTSY